MVYQLEVEIWRAFKDILLREITHFYLSACARTNFSLSIGFSEFIVSKQQYFGARIFNVTS